MPRLLRQKQTLLTDEAHTDAVELLDATKEECRRMVAEARDLRNRTLADLVARRAALRVQLEELRGGKDSLRQVVDSVSMAVETLRDRLASAEDQARIAAEEAGERAELQEGHDELGELEAELAKAAEVEAVEGPSAPGPLEPGGAQSPDETAAATGEPSPGGASPSESSASRRSVDELFARIRASRVAEEAAVAAELAKSAAAPGQAEDAVEAADGAEQAAAQGPPSPAEEEASHLSPEGAQENTAETTAVVAGLDEADPALPTVVDTPGEDTGEAPVPTVQTVAVAASSQVQEALDEEAAFEAEADPEVVADAPGGRPRSRRYDRAGCRVARGDAITYSGP